MIWTTIIITIWTTTSIAWTHMCVPVPSHSVFASFTISSRIDKFIIVITLTSLSVPVIELGTVLGMVLKIVSLIFKLINNVSITLDISDTVRTSGTNGPRRERNILVKFILQTMMNSPWTLITRNRCEISF